MNDISDRRRVQRSALRVGLLVGAASAIVIAAGAGILVAVVLLSARPDDHHRDPGSRPDGDRFVVDVDHVVPWIVALGVLGVIVLGVIAWFAARRAVRPLATALRLQRNFVSDASHELRTPLTALTSRIQIVQRRLARGQPIDDAVAELRRDAANLDDVLTDMLLIAEGASTSTERAAVDTCVTAAVETMRAIAGPARVSVDARVRGNPSARIPSMTLTRLCVALLDNAIAHSPTDSHVVIDARQMGATIELRVTDSGPGIAVADGEKIFERFARGEESGRRRGFGLGLALVREATIRFGGDVRVEKTSPSGTTFLVTLPAA